MAIFKVELDQESYEKLVTLSFDDDRPPSSEIVWLITQAIREAYDKAYPDGGPVPPGGKCTDAYVQSVMAAVALHGHVGQR